LPQKRKMKNDIHPDYHLVNVTLADGSKFTTRSTMPGEDYVSDVDSTNHPFYTGRRQYVDTAGRVEKFRRRYGAKAGTDEGAEESVAEEKAEG
jgi:large subunit ribosomal protein L31